MGQILYGCARMTQVTRGDIQNSQESVDEIAKRLNVNRKKRRSTIKDATLKTYHYSSMGNHI